MAKRLYVKGNYVIADNNGVFGEYPTSRSVYTTTSTAYLIREQIDTGTLVIPFDEIGDWLDAEIGGDPFTEETLKTFLQNNTANFNKGGAKKFAELTDVPPYLNNSLKGLRINATETGVEAYTPTDLNQWLMPNVAFVDPQNGDDDTAIVGDGNLPFLSIQSAQLASTKVLLKAGNYSGTITLTNASYHALDGVVFGASSKLRDGGVSIIATMTGHATFALNSFGIETTAGSIISVFCKEFNNTRSVVWCLNNSISSNVYVTAYKKIKCNNNNGAGMACRVAGGSKVEIVTPEFETDHWAVAFPFGNISGNTIEFTLRCPKIQTNATGFAGNIAKALVNDQGSAVGKSIAKFDLQGGTYKNLSLVQTVAFGVAEGALALQSSRLTVGENSVIEMINGTMYANNMAGVYSYYRMTDGIISLKNLNIKSNTYALRLFLGNYNGVGRQKVYSDNCKFESPNFELGNGKECYFSNVTFNNTNALATSIFTYNAGNPINPLIAYFSNCVAVLENAGSGTVVDGSIVGTLYGFNNTPSTEPSLGLNVVDTWGGATQISTLKTSNILS